MPTWLSCIGAPFVREITRVKILPLAPFLWYNVSMRIVSQEDFDKAGSRDQVQIYCDQCDRIFSRLKHHAMKSAKRGKGNCYCSRSCCVASHSNPITSCLNCGKETKTRFCSQHCSGVFNRTGQYKYPRQPCLECGKITSNQSFCSAKCNRQNERKIYLEKWKRGELPGWSGTKGQIVKSVREYLIHKYDNKCARCGWCEVNPKSGKVPVQIDHIDGDFRNCKEDNLIVLCPNCHSLTPTYMALNKGKGRNLAGIRK
jgi:hypothetical protein